MRTNASSLKTLRFDLTLGQTEPRIQELALHIMDLKIKPCLGSKHHQNNSNGFSLSGKWRLSSHRKEDHSFISQDRYQEAKRIHVVDK